jgi:hypothetical protein
MMKALLAVGWILTVVAAFSAGRSSAPNALSTGSSPSLTQILGEGDFLARKYQFAKYFQGLSPENLDETLALLEKQRFQVTPDEAELFIFAWSSFDPTAAFTWATTAQKTWGTRLDSPAIRAWAYHDPKGALKFLERQPEKRQADLQFNLVTGWIQGGDSEGATVFVFTQPQSAKRVALVDSLLANAAKAGPEGLKLWAMSAPGADRETAVYRASGFITRTDPAAAVEWYETIEEPAWTDGMLENISRTWIRTDEPEALFQWFAELPATEARDKAALTSFSTWSEIDNDEAVAWLTSVDIEPAFDPAIAVYARQLSRGDPAAAIEWANRIQNDKLRKRSFLPILRTWYKRQPNEARAWLRKNENDLPESLQDLIFQARR